MEDIIYNRLNKKDTSLFNEVRVAIDFGNYHSDVIELHIYDNANTRNVVDNFINAWQYKL